MSRMIRFHKFGQAEVLKCEDVATPQPAAGEVQVRVQAIGISWYDVLWRQNLAPSHARLPAGIGHEMAGVVTAVGEGVDEAELLRVAVAGGMAAARNAGHSTASWPSAHSINAPKGR